MNEIAEQEDALFAEWEKAHPGAFFRDGVLCPDRYMASKVRVELMQELVSSLVMSGEIRHKK